MSRMEADCALSSRCPFFCSQTEQKSINELQAAHRDLEGFAGTSDFVLPLILPFLDLSLAVDLLKSGVHSFE